MEKIIICNKDIDKIKADMKNSGKNKIHIVADFDRTLTKAFIKGNKVATAIAQIRNEGFLGEEYVKGAFDLYDKYHPIEINPNLPDKDKIPIMNEWWMKHFNLMKKYGFKKETISEVVGKKTLPLRKGSLEFLDILKKYDIPLIIMSAAIGDLISEYLKQEERLYDNVHIISNFLEFDDNGNMIGFKEPIVHSINKHETVVSDFPVFDLIKERKNVILLGDVVEDIGMVEGFNYDNLIKIGFYNHNNDKDLKRYKKAFDILITGDGDLNYVNKLIKGIIN